MRSPRRSRRRSSIPGRSRSQSSGRAGPPRTRADPRGDGLNGKDPPPMEKTLFYVLGILLVLSALGVAALGLRFPSFPPSRAVLGAVIAYFVALVAATTTFAVLQANTSDERQ